VVHSFPDAEELAVWCAFTRIPADRVRNKRYVQAEPNAAGELPLHRDVRVRCEQARGRRYKRYAAGSLVPTTVPDAWTTT
jgi:hypothetical protein